MTNEERLLLEHRYKKVKVLHLLVGFTIGGTEQLVLNLVSRLNRDRFDVIVCCLKGWGLIGDELKKNGISAVALGCKRKYDIFVIFKLYKLLKSEKPQIIHSHLYWANMIARIVGRMANIPIVISSIHDTDLWMKWFHIYLDRITLSYADKVVTCSKAVKEYAAGLLRKGTNKFIAVYNGVESDNYDKFNKNKEEERDFFTVCYIGRLDEPKKGIKYLIEAIKKLEERKCERIQLLIVGDGPARSELEAIISDYGLAERVIFYGLRRDIPEIIQNIDILVLPSLWEGFGIVLLEAMAASKPVVATNVGGIPEIVIDGETGILVPSKDPQALANAILSIFKNPQEAKEMGKNGRRRVEEYFTIEKTVIQIVAVYDELLKEKLKDQKRY